MPKAILNLLLGSILLIATQACAAPAPATSDPSSINTAVAQTLAAVLTQTPLPGIPSTGQESPTPTRTTAAPTPTATLLTTVAPTSTAILLPSAIFTSTPVLTPGMSQVSVSVPTNCRAGPGTTYERLGGLQVGEVAEVVGRHATRDYWIIRNPDRPAELCWLWGEYATVTGNTGILPVFTPPPTPTPTPGFDASYSGLEGCRGTGWWLDIALENTGGITFQSIAMTVRDTTTDTDLSVYADDFTDRDGCNESNSRDNLPAGEKLRVSSPIFRPDPRGHQFRVTIILCSNNGQSGMCETESITFTP